MTVTIIFPASNKHVVVGSSPKKHSKPDLSLKLDKISVVVQVKNDSLKEEIKKSIYNSSKDSEFFKSIKVPGYKASVALKVGPGSVGISIVPKDKDASFLRLEWNPSALGLEGHNTFASLIGTVLPWGYAEILTLAKVTRADVALDCEGVAITDLEFLPKSPLKSNVYFGPHGETETIYLGSRKSPSFWRIYDKAKEQGLGPNKQITRLEKTVRLAQQFANLPSIKNPFLDLKVLDLSRKQWLAWLSDWQWRQFQDSCRLRGVNSALWSIPKSHRMAYRYSLGNATPAWWAPKLIWEEWPEAVSALIPG